MELRAVVVIPAHDEEDHIAGCLTALAAQTVKDFQVILVLDACRDGTRAVAEASARELGLPLTLVDAAGRGAGAARRTGMDLAAERLLARGLEQGLISCTDADSRPYPDWLDRQLAHVSAGARVIAGDIELDGPEARDLPAGVLARRERDAARRLARVRLLQPAAAHHHFAGASIGVTAGTYRQVGGIEPLPALEDAAFQGRLAEHGIAVLHAADARVRTSARAEGRATRGLAVDLAVSAWRERRRFEAGDFPPPRLRELKLHAGVSVSVVIPAKECAETLAGVLSRTVAPLEAAGVIDEVIVIDAASADGTGTVAREGGARLVQQDSVLSSFGPALGKGDAMWRASRSPDRTSSAFWTPTPRTPTPSTCRD